MTTEIKLKYKMNYRILKTRKGRYFIQRQLFWVWITIKPFNGPTYMESFYHAELAIKSIKRYNAEKQEIVWEG